jgi:hypothetical protein
VGAALETDLTMGTSPASLWVYSKELATSWMRQRWPILGAWMASRGAQVQPGPCGCVGSWQRSKANIVPALGDEGGL